jgi:hypothetical protein
MNEAKLSVKIAAIGYRAFDIKTEFSGERVFICHHWRTCRTRSFAAEKLGFQSGLIEITLKSGTIALV